MLAAALAAIVPAEAGPLFTYGVRLGKEHGDQFVVPPRSRLPSLPGAQQGLSSQATMERE